MGRFHRHDDGTEHSHDDAGELGHHGHGYGHGHGHEPHDANRDHGDHSGYATGADRVLVLERIFDENDRAAAANRELLDEAGIVALNVMSSPGAGKTTLLAEMLRRLPEPGRIGVVEGDIETSIDADRLSRAGARVSLLNTANGFGGECHLDAPMVAAGLRRLPLDELDLLIVENVGNLVCPAEFDVGAHHRVMVYSITEGEEKPLKYPVMFRAADVVVVNKMDLLPHLDFDLDLFEHNLRQINPGACVLRVSARTGAGMDLWLDWIEGVRARPASRA